MTGKITLIVNDQGKPKSVIINIRKYNAMMRDLEEYALIKAYDKAKSTGGKDLDYKTVVSELLEKFNSPGEKHKSRMKMPVRKQTSRSSKPVTRELSFKVIVADEEN